MWGMIYTLGPLKTGFSTLMTSLEIFNTQFLATWLSVTYFSYISSECKQYQIRVPLRHKRNDSEQIGSYIQCCHRNWLTEHKTHTSFILILRTFKRKCSSSSVSISRKGHCLALDFVEWFCLDVMVEQNILTWYVWLKLRFMLCSDMNRKRSCLDLNSD